MKFRRGSGLNGVKTVDDELGARLSSRWRSESVSKVRRSDSFDEPPGRMSV